MNEVCTCGHRFRDAEDFRDHFPCPGSDAERAYERGKEDGVVQFWAMIWMAMAIRSREYKCDSCRCMIPIYQDRCYCCNGAGARHCDEIDDQT